MSSSGPSYLCSSSLVQESPISDKYYLQLADHSLLDLLREAVKSILIFNLPLEELPILQLQKEIYLIYDNRIVKEQDILDTVKHEIRQTAKLQKKFLDMSFTYLEKEKSSLSDMRDSEEDIWSVSWNRHRAKDTDDSLKKSYGVVANLFCNNYATFVQSIREISRLLEHLHRECLIPAIDTEKLEEALMEIVTHQFFLQYNCLDLHKVLPIMAQPQKERFVYCSQFGIDLRKKISKYTCDQSIYDLFMPKKQQSPQRLTESPEQDNKNELKQIMKEMFLKEFRNNDIISPLLFDQKGKLKLFDPSSKDECDDDDDQLIEKQIAKLAAKKQIKNDSPKKEVKPEQPDVKKEVKFQQKIKPEQVKKEVKIEEPKKEVKIQQSKKDIKLEQPKKEAKPQQAKKQIKAQQVKKEVKPENVKIQLKIDQSDKKINGSTSIPTPALSKPASEKPSLQESFKKVQTTKQQSEITAKSLKNLLQKNQQIKQAHIQPKEKSKRSTNEICANKDEKTKVVSESKTVTKQIKKEQKPASIKNKEGKSIEHPKQASKPNEQTAESLQISTTKIVLSSGTTLEARVTSLTISAEDPDKLNKNINLLKDIHAIRKTNKSNAQVLQQIAKDYGKSEIKFEILNQPIKGEEDEKYDQVQAEEANKKKKKKNKKKKNKKGQQSKQELTRVKSESLGLEVEKIQLVKSVSVQKTQQTKQDSLTQEERIIYNNIENLEIDDRSRVACKIDEEVLNNWRKKFFALKKSFLK